MAKTPLVERVRGCRIAGAVPGSTLRPTDPQARLVGQAPLKDWITR